MRDVNLDALETAFEHDPSMPGKFEAEPAWTVYYWHCMMDGDGEPLFETCELCVGDPDRLDECECEPSCIGDSFEITKGERRVFPELGDCKLVELTYSDQGFVGGHAS